MTPFFTMPSVSRIRVIDSALLLSTPKFYPTRDRCVQAAEEPRELDSGRLEDKGGFVVTLLAWVAPLDDEKERLVTPPSVEFPPEDIMFQIIVQSHLSL